MVVGLILLGLVSFTSNDPDKGGRGEDLHCYRSIVDRIRSGEGYYQATYSELSARGYPTGSIFNWRPPLLGWTFGHLPDLRFAQATAIILSLFTIWLWVSISSKELSFRRVAAGALLLLGAPIYSFLPDIYLAHEFWAGSLITLSIFSYAKGWRCLALTAGILSLLTRELALPFVAVMSAFSIHERKYGEAFVWAAGIAIFFIMMLLHSFSLKEFAQPANIIYVKRLGHSGRMDICTRNDKNASLSFSFARLAYCRSCTLNASWVVGLEGSIRIKNRADGRYLHFDIFICWSGI